MTSGNLTDGAFEQSETHSSISKDETERKKKAKKRTRAGDEFLRAPNEDDDGYDPYSDRRERTPLFERDPWA